jgi:type 1 glutamine amidotransferase
MRAALLALLAVGLGLSGFPDASATGADAAKIPLLIIDGQNNHDWRATTPLVKQLLEASGRFTVAVSSNLRTGDKPGTVENTVPFPPDLSGYAVVVSNYNGAAWPEALQKALADRLRDGRLGLVVFHAANNSFKDWPEFNRMIGMGWRNNAFGDRVYFEAGGKEVRQPKGEGVGAGETSLQPFRLAVRDLQHPITKDMPTEWMHAPDQLVHGLRGPIEEVHVLATAWSDRAKRGTGEHEPMIWTVGYGKGRVFHTPMGHNATSIRCVGFATTLQRGAEWAATGQVTVPIPKDFPTADQVSAWEAK